MDPISRPSLRAVLARVHAALDEAAACEVGGDEELGGLAGSIERASARLDALLLRVTREADRQRAAQRSGMSSTGAWLARQTHTTPAQAARTSTLADALDDRLGATRSALAAGRLSRDHAAVIERATRDLPSDLTAEQVAEVEESLVAKAAKVDPARLRRYARRALAAVEPDPAVVDAHEDQQVRQEEQDAWDKASFSLHDNGDGTFTGRFTLPALQAEILRRILDAMTAPRRAHLGAGRAQTGDVPGAGQDWSQRRGQAFAELVEHLPTDHLHPEHAATVVVTISHDVLQSALRAAGLDTGERLSAGEARRLACAAGLLPVVLGGASQPLDLGRTRRLYTRAQRVALSLRHHTCAAAGCERPFAWTEIHHRRPWSADGGTDLDNAVPLCHFHHRRIHDPAYEHHFSPGGVLFRRHGVRSVVLTA